MFIHFLHQTFWNGFANLVERVKSIKKENESTIKKHQKCVTLNWSKINVEEKKAFFDSIERKYF